MSNKKRIQKLLKRKYKYQGLLSSIKIFHEYKKGWDFALNGRNKVVTKKDLEIMKTISMKNGSKIIFGGGIHAGRSHSKTWIIEYLKNTMSQKAFERDYCQNPISKQL